MSKYFSKQLGSNKDRKGIKGSPAACTINKTPIVLLTRSGSLTRVSAIPKDQPAAPGKTTTMRSYASVLAETSSSKPTARSPSPAQRVLAGIKNQVWKRKQEFAGPSRLKIAPTSSSFVDPKINPAPTSSCTVSTIKGSKVHSSKSNSISRSIATSDATLTLSKSKANMVDSTKISNKGKMKYSSKQATTNFVPTTFLLADSKTNKNKLPTDKINSEQSLETAVMGLKPKEGKGKNKDLEKENNIDERSITAIFAYENSEKDHKTFNAKTIIEAIINRIVAHVGEKNLESILFEEGEDIEGLCMGLYGKGGSWQRVVKIILKEGFTITEVALSNGCIEFLLNEIATTNTPSQGSVQMTNTSYPFLNTHPSIKRLREEAAHCNSKAQEPEVTNHYTTRRIAWGKFEVNGVVIEEGVLEKETHATVEESTLYLNHKRHSWCEKLLQSFNGKTPMDRKYTHQARAIGRRIRLINEEADGVVSSLRLPKEGGSGVKVPREFVLCARYLARRQCCEGGSPLRQSLLADTAVDSHISDTDVLPVSISAPTDITIVVEAERQRIGQPAIEQDTKETTNTVQPSTAGKILRKVRSIHDLIKQHLPTSLTFKIKKATRRAVPTDCTRLAIHPERTAPVKGMIRDTPISALPKAPTHRRNPSQKTNLNATKTSEQSKVVGISTLTPSGHNTSATIMHKRRHSDSSITENISRNTTNPPSQSFQKALHRRAQSVKFERKLSWGS